MQSCNGIPKVWVGVVSLMAIVWMLPFVQILFQFRLPLCLQFVDGDQPLNTLQKPCRGKFAWLGNHPSLATRKDATVGNVPQVFFQAVFVIWPIWAHISTAQDSKIRITTLGQPPAA